MTREIALRALDRRAYGRVELAQYLARKGAEHDPIEQVLRRFEEVGLINDTAFAQQWVDTRQRGRLLPRRALTVELRRKGIDEETIAEAVAPVDHEVEADSALEFARRKARSAAGLDREVALRRIAGALGRRGFSGELAWSSARQALEELAEP
ncbi:regulatory protein RecX [Brooklawnia sp.]|uniref:regulatory protein RecX n=1 Tax=Brooklawnia sp. TaxID=2699740 RepID=UPI00311FAA6E